MIENLFAQLAQQLDAAFAAVSTWLAWVLASLLDALALFGA